MNRAFSLFLVFSAGSAAADPIEFPIGVTPDDQPIIAHVTAEDFEIGTTKFRPLFVCTPTDLEEVKTWTGPIGDRITASVIAIPNGLEFPPEGSAYQGEHSTAHAIWRWLGMHAPDLVIDLRGEESQQLLAALKAYRPCGVGVVPGVLAKEVSRQSAMEALLSADAGPSPARLELQNRVDRSAVEIAEALSEHYPGKLSQIAYIPALALVGRMRTGELTGNAEHLDFAREQLEKWLAATPSRPEKFSGSWISGILMFSEFAKRTKDERAWAWILEAGKVGLDSEGKPLEVVPTHNQMSDAVFMACPLLAEAGQRSGDERFYVAAVQHLRSMKNWCLREDGIYRHSPLDEAAWGRGNGFPALGLTLTLAATNPDFEGYDEIRESLTNHLAALAKHQDPSGMFHQVINRRESYREFTSTCMITFSILRGLRSNYLDRNHFEPIADRAWEAIKMRIAMDGESLVDVCTGTGKQKNLRVYYERKAILGRDDRGGAMALMVATERAFWERERADR